MICVWSLVIKRYIIKKGFEKTIFEPFFNEWFELLQSNEQNPFIK